MKETRHNDRSEREDLYYSDYMQKQKTQQGFSLIELIVVTAIIAIMTAVLLVSMTQGRVAREVETAGRGVAAVLRQAQNNALTGAIIETGNFPCHFIFHASTGSYSMSVSQRDSSISSSSCNSTPIVSYNLENDVHIDTTDIDEIYFVVPFGKMTDSVGDTIGDTKQLVVTKDTARFYVCIYPTGQIEESKAGCL